MILTNTTAILTRRVVKYAGSFKHEIDHAYFHIYKCRYGDIILKIHIQNHIFKYVLNENKTPVKVC